MNNEIFESKIKPVLTYIGIIGASITSIAYIILMFVLIKGFEYQQTTQTITFAVINAAVGLIIANFLKYQGISFAKELDENKELVKEYYATKTKDKKNHSLGFFWTTSLIKDILIKGLSVAFVTCGLIYIVIVGSNDWNLLLLAIVNLLLFICFGLLSLNKAYEYYNNIYVNYMKEQIKNKEIKKCSNLTAKNTETSKTK
nr:MAG TPA: hypothetical protein [Caudoviricetes sp.]